VRVGQEIIRGTNADLNGHHRTAKVLGCLRKIASESTDSRAAREVGDAEAAGLLEVDAEDGVEFDGVGGDAALAVEEIEEGNTCDVDDDHAGNVLEGRGGRHAEAGFECGARGFKRGGVLRRTRPGTFRGGDFGEHGGGRIRRIGEDEVEVAIAFLFDGDELRADGEGLEFQGREAGVRRKRRRGRLGSEPGNRGRAGRKVDAGDVRVGESLDEPALSAAMNAAGDVVLDMRTKSRTLTLVILTVKKEDGHQGE
jgi:hypothetical protein